MRLMSDVPLGMFLSGGVDSSAIAAIIKRQADGPVKTFSVGYSESQFSELSEARQVASKSAPTITKSRSPWRTSSTLCRGWSGTKTNPSPGRRASRFTLCRSSPRRK